MIGTKLLSTFEAHLCKEVVAGIRHVGRTQELQAESIIQRMEAAMSIDLCFEVVGVICGSFAANGLIRCISAMSRGNRNVYHDIRITAMLGFICNGRPSLMANSM